MPLYPSLPLYVAGARHRGKSTSEPKESNVQNPVVEDIRFHIADCLHVHFLSRAIPCEVEELPSGGLLVDGIKVLRA